ncbi:hypothetical protein IscW_ISCW009875, partial [Ixodes scapularis]
NPALPHITTPPPPPPSVKSVSLSLSVTRSNRRPLFWCLDAFLLLHLFGASSPIKPLFSISLFVFSSPSFVIIF